MQGLELYSIMFQKFRETHLFSFLHRLDRDGGALDWALKEYFKSHKSIGAHDRRFIGDTVYLLIRWKNLLDLALGREASWEERYAARSILSNPPSELPLWARCGATEWFYQELRSFLPEERAVKICRVLNEQAPVTIRANLLKTTREELLQRLPCPAEACSMSKSGIRLMERIPLTALPEFKQGFFEIQDEGSQLVAELVECLPGQQVMDYCSGSGGKTLAFAHLMQGRGQIYLHDIRSHILVEAKKRLRRAGIQNAQFLPPGHSRLNSLKNSLDWVLADVPCSGSGTYRRNPDMKWKMGEEQIQELLTKQRMIVAEAAEYLRPGGRMVYATCSIFERENEKQLENFPLEVEKVLRLDPKSGGHDGFFAAVLRKKL